jgi:hypothetical protein
MLEALEAFGPAAFFRTSVYLYPLVNLIHVLAIGALVTTAVLMDLRVLGLGRGIALETVIRYLRPVAVGGLAVAVLSGATLFSVQPVDYFANDAFRLKMLLLAVAIANGAAFTSFRVHRAAERLGARLMAVASIALWLSVASAGRMIGFVA